MSFETSDTSRRIRSTSRVSADGDPFILSENASFRLMFIPRIADNPKNVEACVSGKFIKQRKGVDDNWETVQTVPCTRLKKGEEFTLLLDSEQTCNLIKGIEDYRDYFIRHGIPNGEERFVVTKSETFDALKLISRSQAWEYLVEVAEKFDVTQLSHIASTANFLQLTKSIETLEQGLTKGYPERWWQERFIESPWVLGQLFTQPMILLDGQAYMGGKDIGNKHGKVADYLVKNHLTGNVAIIDIKTPNSFLLNPTEYRNRTYGISSEIAGAVSQVLIFKDHLAKSFTVLKEESEQEFLVFNPRCVVVAGSLSEIDEKGKRRSFELFRSSLKDVELVTFDELITRCNSTLKLLDYTECDE